MKLLPVMVRAPGNRAAASGSIEIELGDAVRVRVDEAALGLPVSFMANQLPQAGNLIELHDRVRVKWGTRVAYIVGQRHPDDQYLMMTPAS